MKTNTNPEAKETTMTASDFTYDIHSQEDTDAFFALMARAGVQQERIDAMQQTLADFLAAEER